MSSSISPPTGGAVGGGPRPRFGQLTYTSFDDGGDRGGWQIKERKGQLTDDESEMLRSRVGTRLDPGIELPRFPTPDEVAALPRRMVLAPADAAAVAIWHTALAGADASGRIGNVFAHVLLDRDPGKAGPRPIDLWRSVDWLTPYGADQVLAARLPPIDEPSPGSVVSTTRVVDFVLAPSAWRVGVLSLLLDACLHAMSGGPPVILGTGSADAAAMWVGALTHLMDPRTARRFFFSTIERANTLQAARSKGLHLICMPTGDLVNIDRHDRSVVVLDEDEDIMLGELHAAPHRTVRGDQIAVTEWSSMAQVVLVGPDESVWALDRLDSIAAEMRSAGFEPCWPLAMVVAESLDDFGDAMLEAAAVIVRSTPDEVRAHPRLLAVASGLLARSLGQTTEDAWQGLTRLLSRDQPSSIMGELASRIYLRRVVGDPDWLARPTGVELPGGLATGLDDDSIIDEVNRTLQGLAVGEQPSDRAPLIVLRLADVVSRVGPLRDDLQAVLSRAVQDIAVPALLDRFQGARLVEQVGPVSQRLQAVLVRPLVARALPLASRPLGERVDPDVLDWLFPEGDHEGLPAHLGRLDAVDRLRAERAFQLLLAKPASSRHLVPLALWAWLDESDPAEPLPAVFARNAVLSARLLERIETRFPGRLPLGLFMQTVKSTESGPDLASLCRRLQNDYGRPLSGSEDRAALDLVWLRLRQDERPEWWRTSRLTASLDRITSGGLAGIKAGGPPFARDAVRHLVPAAVLSILYAQSSERVEMLGSVVFTVFSTAEAEPMLDILTQAIVRGGDLVPLLTAMVYSNPQSPAAGVAGSQYLLLDQIRCETAMGSSPILVECFRRQVQLPNAIRASDLAEDFRVQLWSVLTARHENPAKLQRACDHFVADWLKELYPRSDNVLGIIRHWTGRGGAREEAQ